MKYLLDTNVFREIGKAGLIRTSPLGSIASMTSILRWGEFLAASEKHADDAGLAATARVHKLTMVTRNTRDFVARGIATLDPFKSI